jgi:Ca2+-binding EF-hand superfamily protein
MSVKTLGSNTLEEAKAILSNDKVDDVEKAEVPPRISAAVEEQVQEIFEAIDTNHNGRLEITELQVGSDQGGLFFSSEPTDYYQYEYSI